MPSFTLHRACNAPIQPRYHSNSSTYSITPSPSPSPSPPPTIHNRRTIASRTNSSSRRSPPPPSLPGLGLHVSPFAAHSNPTSNSHARSNPKPNSNSNSNSDPNPNSHSEPETQQQGESDAECWERMLALQREYHCYNSARLEAAVEALEKGCRIEDVPMPSRFCLDLLNEELKAQIEASSLQ